MTQEPSRSTFWESLLGYADHIRLLWVTAPVWSTLCLVATVVAASSGILVIVAIGQMVTSLSTALSSGGSTTALWTWFTLFTTATLLGQIANATVAWGEVRCSAAYRIRLDELIAELGMTPENLGRLEDPEFSERLETLTTNSRGWLLRNGLTGIWLYLNIRLSALGAAGIAFAWHPWVPMVVAGCYLSTALVSRRYLDDLIGQIFENPSEERRRAEYLGRLMTHPDAAKEVRLFNMAPWLLHNYQHLWRTSQNPIWQGASRKARPLVFSLMLQALVLGGVLVLLAYEAAAGRTDAATVTTVALAIIGMSAFGPLGDIETGLIRTAAFVRSLYSLRRSIGLPDTRLLLVETASRARHGAVGIDIEDLTYTYASRDAATLSRLSLHVPAGQSLAIVGVNGAGKSTLIKLLAGLYQPDSGSVRIGGKDPYGDKAARGSVAVVFQEFVKYPLSLRDNVAFGAIGNDATQVPLDKALRDAAGTDVLQRLGGNWDTPLSKDFEGGTDLSGGQWQRVALARAFAAVGGGAGLLVLDEPTAALDVRAEAEIFDRFLEMTHGVTTVLVSHRLSTVRRADRIVVLDGATGQISEDGTHQQLMTLGGAYATMFTLQASRFAAAGETPA